MRWILPVLAVLVATQAATTRAEITWWFDLDDSYEGITQGIIDQITASMDVAVGTYNLHSQYNWWDVAPDDRGIRVAYHQSVPTANASYKGRIAFGGSRGQSTAMHEMSHVLGVGTYWNWGNFREAGKWTGVTGTAEVRELNDNPDSLLNVDTAHMWPYGLNQSSEDSEYNRYGHVRMVGAVRQDMGLYNGNATELPGDFNNDGRVDAADYTVYRDAIGDGTVLTNGLTATGSTTRDLARWEDGYGSTLRNLAAVPEPTGLASLLVGATMLACRRRRAR